MCILLILAFLSHSSSRLTAASSSALLKTRFLNVWTSGSVSSAGGSPNVGTLESSADSSVWDPDDSVFSAVVPVLETLAESAH